jgi:shikimate dehydrogenase
VAIENRTRVRAEMLAARLRDAFPAADVVVGHRPGATYDVAVNATSLGMHDGDALPMTDAVLDASRLVAECVITREITPLLERARARGRAVHGGMPMLEAQMELLLDFMGVGPALGGVDA